MMRRHKRHNISMPPSNESSLLSSSFVCNNTLPWRECQCLRHEQTSKTLSVTSSLSQPTSPISSISTRCPAELSSASICTLSNSEAVTSNTTSLSSQQTVLSNNITIGKGQHAQFSSQQVSDDSQHQHSTTLSERHQPRRNECTMSSLFWLRPPVKPSASSTLSISFLWSQLQSMHRLFVVFLMTLAVCSTFTPCDTQSILPFTAYTSAASSSSSSNHEDQPKPNRTLTLLQLSQMNRKIRQPNLHLRMLNCDLI